MADGVPITAGSGTTVLTDDTGAGGHAQVVKLAISTDGSGTLIPADGTDGLLVHLGANNNVAVTAVTPGTGATDLGKAEDAAHASGDVGVQVLTVRRDTPAGSAGTAGDYQPPTTDALGRTWVVANREVRVTATPTIGAALYAAGDLFGTVMTFSNVAEVNGGSGRIVGATITNRDTEFPILELWLFRNSPTMVNADNGVFDITDANLETAELIGVIEFSAFYNATNNNVATGAQRGMPLGGHPLHYLCASASTSIYGVFAIRTGVTPASTSDVVVALYCEME